MKSRPGGLDHLDSYEDDYETDWAAAMKSRPGGLDHRTT